MGYKSYLSLVCFFIIPSLSYAEDTLIFAVDIIRHGDRTPINPLPGVNGPWKEGPGQLTAEGMQQEYQMGVQFRKRYIEESHLLPKHYKDGTLYVRATFYDRTLMSAESLLMGLYPPGTGPNYPQSNPALPYAFQPIPIFSAPAKFDDVIVQQVNPQEKEKLLEHYVYSTKEWQQKNNDLKSKYPLWSDLVGIEIKDLEDLQPLGDTLFIHQLYHAPMPSGLSDTDIETIIDASNWALMARERPKELANLQVSQLMTHIANYLDNGSSKTSQLKYILISAHDTTLARVLSYLEAPLEKVPPYASNVNFSLYENGDNYYTVKVTYNGSPVYIPACEGTVCELQQFIKMVKKV